ncbi:hypothetical protein [Microbacterium sp. S1037]|uniref:hypothetical protein n=1 Tax=Microbacterium sp. S1037 TaxID=3398227 RepID=UPI003AAD6FE3
MTLVQVGAAPVISVKAEWGTPFAVKSLTSVRTRDSAAGSTTKITIDGSVGWRAGTLIKVFSNDPIPGARSASGDRVARSGEYAIVASSSGGEVLTMAPLRQKHSDNTRVVEVSRRTADIRGFTVEGRSPTAKVVGAPLIYLAGLLAPSVDDIRCISAHGPVIHMKSCYAFTVSRLDVAFAEDDAPRLLGYGVLDNCSAFGTVQNSTVRHARHAYTDDAPPIPASSADPHGYGSSYGNKVVACSAVSPSRSGFDTHHPSEGTLFLGCSVSAAADDVAAFSLRGRNHRVIGCSAEDVGTGVRAFTEATRGGESFGHIVQSFSARTIRGAAVAADINPTGHPSAGKLESRPVLTITGVTVDGVMNAIRARNASVFVRDASISVTADQEGSSFVQNEGSDLYIDDSSFRADVTAKWSPIASTAAEGRSVRLSLRNVAFQMSPSSMAQADTIFTGAAPRADLRAVTFSDLPPNGIGGVEEGSSLQWETQSSGLRTPSLSSAAHKFSGDLASQMPEVWKSADAHVVVELSADSDRASSVPLQAAQRQFQLLTLICAPESVALQLVGSPTAPLNTQSETARSIQPGQAVTLVWSSRGWTTTA